MNLWYLSDLGRLEHERTKIEELAGCAAWLRGVLWSFDRGSLCVDADIEVTGRQYSIRLRYPEYYPAAAPTVWPRGTDERWSEHQWGARGELCLEWGPDNWQPGVTGADVLESAYRLLSREANAALDPAVPPVPSRHESTLGQDLRREGARLTLVPTVISHLVAMPTGSSAVGRIRVLSWADALLGFFEGIDIGEDTWDAPEIPKGVQRSGFLIRAAVLRVAEPIDVKGCENLEGLLSRFNEAGCDVSRIDEVPNGAMGPPECVVIAGPSGHPETFWLSREKDSFWRWTAVQVSRPDDSARLGEIAGSIDEKRVAIVGLGSVGSKVAVSLARSGVRHFFLVDDDVLLPENVCRNGLDWRDVGAHKVNAVVAQMECIATGIDAKVARLQITGQESTARVAAVLSVLGHQDLVIDTTASDEAFCVLAEVCSQSSTPMVWAEVFAGGVGGLLARFKPGRDPDPVMARAHVNAWMVEHPDEDAEDVGDYAARNGERIVVASDADVSVVAAHATRIALDLLSENEPPEHPHAVYLVGMKRGWVFQEPFHTLPIDVGGPTKPVDQEYSEDTIRFLGELIRENHGEDPSPS